jgi:hypothetical protein
MNKGWCKGKSGQMVKMACNVLMPKAILIKTTRCGVAGVAQHNVALQHLDRKERCVSPSGIQIDGRRRTKVVPLPNWLSTCTLPW